jgi:hypothetical protein
MPMQQKLHTHKPSKQQRHTPVKGRLGTCHTRLNHTCLFIHQLAALSTQQPPQKEI